MLSSDLGKPVEGVKNEEFRRGWQKKCHLGGILTFKIILCLSETQIQLRVLCVIWQPWFKAVRVCVRLVAQSCRALCHPMDCSPPGSSVHRILQARILEWVAISSSRGSSLTQGSNPCLLHCRHIRYHLRATWEVPIININNYNYLLDIIHCFPRIELGILHTSHLVS